MIEESLDFIYEKNFMLPPWTFWSPEDWKGKSTNCSEIIDNMLGWDLTDFGSDDFHKRGLILFTLRNGNPLKDKKNYAEKVMIVEELQETPMHFHWSKMEDIINRGESICLEQGMYHRFYGEQGKGKVLVGEVSAVNDDATDNRFFESIGRFLLYQGKVQQSSIHNELNENYI